jgi:hypothetical protein
MKIIQKLCDFLVKLYLDPALSVLILDTAHFAQLYALSQKI